jgi:hypothetical protein
MGIEDAQQKKTTLVLGGTGTEVLDGRNAHLLDGVQCASSLGTSGTLR